MPRTYIEHDLDAAPANLVGDSLELWRRAIGTTKAGLYECLAVLNEEIPSTLVGTGRDLHQLYRNISNIRVKSRTELNI